jgi:hypothetical protein
MIIAVFQMNWTVAQQRVQHVLDACINRIVDFFAHSSIAKDLVDGVSGFLLVFHMFHHQFMDINCCTLTTTLNHCPKTEGPWIGRWY